MRWAVSHATTPSVNTNFPTPNASLRGVTVGPDGHLWCTENFANKIGHMAADGTLLGEYDIPTAASGARCIASLSNGRLYSRNMTPGRSARSFWTERNS